MNAEIRINLDQLAKLLGRIVDDEIAEELERLAKEIDASQEGVAREIANTLLARAKELRGAR